MIYAITLFQFTEWIIIFVLCVLSVIVFIRSVKKQHYLKAQLETKNQELKTISANNQLQIDQIKAKLNKANSLSEFKEGVTQLLLHDLKNPLSLLINYELFSKELLGRAANQMLNIVTNIGDIQHYENAKMNADIREVRVSEVLKNASHQIEYSLKEKKIKYYNNINDDLMVYADEKLLERIFVNLLLNAIKYSSHEGCININAETDKDKIKISITDTGYIIPEDVQSLLFDKYGLLVAKKSNASRDGNLGLSYCKLALEAHNEKIFVKSDNDQTTFWFTLKGVGTYNNLSTESKLQVAESEIKLSKENKEFLKQYIHDLRSLKVYEFSAVRKIIKQIEVHDNPNIKSWVNNLNQTVKSGDEELYNNLLKLAE
jgi:signal transduction histidine kinase